MQRRIKYYYDTQTCRYERVKTSKWDYVVNAIGLLFLCTVVGFLLSAIHGKYFPTRQETQLMKENQELLYSYRIIKEELAEAGKMLDVLQDRDDNIYRVIFEQEPIPVEIRIAGAGGSSKYQDLVDGDLSRKDLIVGTLERIDNLKRQMYIQTKSYDELIEVASNKADMWASIPAIQPISNNDLKRFASGYGMRMHPIYKMERMHAGCDFSAPTGTPIYSTGDGVVKAVKKHYTGYGTHVIIDHGFGYETLYGHMSHVDVKKGQKVTRGFKIGEVGNTGTSVAPHCHYEVHKDGRHVNPVHYFHKELSPAQYDILLEKAEQKKQSLGGGI